MIEEELDEKKISSIQQNELAKEFKNCC